MYINIKLINDFVMP